jgi:hypothetical protein
MKDGQYDCFSKERLVGICLEGDCVAKIADYHCETYPDKYKVQPTEPPGG